MVSAVIIRSWLLLMGAVMVIKFLGRVTGYLVAACCIAARRLNPAAMQFAHGNRCVHVENVAA